MSLRTSDRTVEVCILNVSSTPAQWAPIRLSEVTAVQAPIPFNPGMFRDHRTLYFRYLRNQASAVVKQSRCEERKSGGEEKTKSREEEAVKDPEHSKMNEAKVEATKRPRDEEGEKSSEGEKKQAKTPGQGENKRRVEKRKVERGDEEGDKSDKRELRKIPSKDLIFACQVVSCCMLLSWNSICTCAVWSCCLQGERVHWKLKQVLLPTLQVRILCQAKGANSIGWGE